MLFSKKTDTNLKDKNDIKGGYLTVFVKNAKNCCRLNTRINMHKPLATMLLGAYA
jgi:hypothetical protein